MLTLADHVSALFSFGGPVHREMSGSNPSVHTWRPLQRDYAIAHANFLMKQSNKNAPLISFENVEAGQGKTLAYSVVEAANIVLNGYTTRSIIATFTRDLRHEIKDGETKVNNILVEYRQNHQNGHEFPLTRPVTFGSRESFSAACSVDKAQKLLDKAKRGKWSNLTEVQRYHDEVMLKYKNGDVPMLAEWLISNNGVFPFDPNMSEKDFILAGGNSYFALDHEEMRHLATDPNCGKAIKAMLSNNRALKNCDILSVTHALFVMDRITFGNVLDSAPKKTKTPSVAKKISVLIDEADMLADQAKTLDGSLSATVISDIIKPLKISKSFNRFSQEMISIWRAAQVKKICYVARTSLHKIFVKSIIDFHDDILDAMSKRMKYINVVEEARLEYLITELRLRAAIITHCDGRSTPFANSVKQAEIYNIIEGSSTKLFALTIKALQPKFLLAPSWYAHTNYMSHISFTSGTLIDINNSFSDFGKSVGVKSFNGFGKDYIAATDHEIMIPDRRSGQFSPRYPSKIIISNALAIPPILNNTINPTHVDFVTNFLNNQIASKSDNKTTLVLCSSFAFMEEMKLALVNWSGPRNLIFQNRLMGAKADVAKINPGDIVFSTNYCGINYVRNGKTLIDRVIITKLPYKPPVVGKSTGECPDTYVLRKVIQGLMRAMRFNGDYPEVVFMDYRVKRPMGGTAIINAPSLSEAIYAHFPPSIIVEEIQDDKCLTIK